jgi:hypothetical protein
MDLAGMLCWRKVKPLHINSNKEFRSRYEPPGEEIKEEIRRLNERDVELYKEALRLRKLRRERMGSYSNIFETPIKRFYNRLLGSQ